MLMSVIVILTVKLDVSPTLPLIPRQYIARLSAPTRAAIESIIIVIAIITVTVAVEVTVAAVIKAIATIGTGVRLQVT